MPRRKRRRPSRIFVKEEIKANQEVYQEVYIDKDDTEEEKIIQNLEEEGLDEKRKNSD